MEFAEETEEEEDFDSSPYKDGDLDFLDATDHYGDGKLQSSNKTKEEYSPNKAVSNDAFGNYAEDFDLFDEEYELPDIKQELGKPGLASIMANNADKAGLDQVDKEKVNKVINQSTRGSRFFNKTQKDDERTKARVQNMLKAHAQMKKEDFAHFTRSADRLIEKLESDRDLSKSWLHVDMDAFYASVEIRDDPKLAGIPMAVGSTSMLCTSSYEARKFGVRSAMPGFIALKLCPNLTIVRPDFTKYKEASYQTREIFARYDPKFEAYSLDEASLDITAYLADHPGQTAENTALEIRKAMQEETRLTCSIGIACNRRLAKICSNINKPDGQFLLPSVREDIVAFMENLSIRKASGIGKVTEKLLNALNITKCGQLYTERATLLCLFSALSADFFFRIALGLGPVLHAETRANRSVSTERTFAHTSDTTALVQICHKLSHSLAETLEKKGMEGKTLTLKIKTANFETRSRSITLSKYFGTNGEEIFTHARKFLMEEMPIDIRLMGVRMSGFKESQSQSSPKQTLIDGYFGKSIPKENPNTIPPANTKTSPTHLSKITYFYKTQNQNNNTQNNNNQSNNQNNNNPNNNDQNNNNQAGDPFDNNNQNQNQDQNNLFTHKEKNKKNQNQDKNQDQNQDSPHYNQEKSQNQSQNEQKRETVCPICSKDLTMYAKDNFRINMHVDNCLLKNNSKRQSKPAEKNNKKRKK
eukprot:Phypoly_transcript_04060.p1 GENE.Phypoly_transcript_04060~~Phypoly_transcript_04060.p1  ORF type:complete len:702 (+),score=149.82 Phypoly_transcript_04060:86-2191(+)